MEQTLTAAADTQQAGQDLRGVAGSYLRFCAGHLTQLEECIARQDLASVCKIAHVLRGNASRIGLSELSSLGRQLEEYCFGRDWSAIDSTYRAIVGTVLNLCEGTRAPIPVNFESNGHIRVFNVKTVE